MEHRRTVKVRLLEAYSRRRSGGKVLEPGLAALHQPQVLRAMVSNEQHHHQGVADNKLRENSALDQTSQGFREFCAVPGAGSVAERPAGRAAD